MRRDERRNGTLHRELRGEDEKRPHDRVHIGAGIIAVGTLGRRLERETLDRCIVGALPARHAEREVIKGAFVFRDVSSAHYRLADRSARMPGLSEKRTPERILVILTKIPWLWITATDMAETSAPSSVAVSYESDDTPCDVADPAGRTFAVGAKMSDRLDVVIRVGHGADPSVSSSRPSPRS
jgi:hypothetical protein